jgi:hypothetical protein
MRADSGPISGAKCGEVVPFLSTWGIDRFDTSEGLSKIGDLLQPANGQQDSEPEQAKECRAYSSVG